MSNRFNLLYLSAISAILVSCGGNTQAGDDSQQFKLLEIQPKEVSLNNSYSASIKGQQDIKIIPRVDGYLTDILVKEGAKVQKGQTLFVIDQVSYKAALQVAKANVAVSEANVANATLFYDSKLNLHKKKIVSDFDLTSAENDLKTAKATLLQAKAQEDAAANNLSFTVIKSPSNGVIGKIPYRKGDYVGPTIQDGLTVVAENSQMYVYFSMTERQVIGLINQHQSLENAIEQMPSLQLKLVDNTIYPHPGKIESISGVIESSTGAVSIRAVFQNKDGMLFSGGAGSIIFPYQLKDAIIIPQEATFEIQDKTYVYKVIDGTAVSTIVSIDKINNGKEYIVTEGLTPSDIIIAEGAGLVQEGTKVKTQSAQ